MVCCRDIENRLLLHITGLTARPLFIPRYGVFLSQLLLVHLAGFCTIKVGFGTWEYGEFLTNVGFYLMNVEILVIFDSWLTF